VTDELLRVRFKANSEDPRPIKWPVEHPYWISAEGDGYAIVISYANDEDYILENWPEAHDLDSERVDGYRFTDRFLKPDWFQRAS
jgi:hypothetical protein